MTRKVQAVTLCVLFAATVVLSVSPSRAQADPANSQVVVKLEKARLMERQAALVQDEAAVWRQLAEIRERQAELLAERARLMERELRLSAPASVEPAEAGEDDGPDLAPLARPDPVDAAEPDATVDAADATAEPDDDADEDEPEDEAVSSDMGRSDSQEMTSPLEEEAPAESPATDPPAISPAEPEPCEPLDAAAAELVSQIASALDPVVLDAVRMSQAQVARLVGWARQLHVDFAASPTPTEIADPSPATAITPPPSETAGQSETLAPETEPIIPADPGLQPSQDPLPLEERLSTPDSTPVPCLDPAPVENPGPENAQAQPPEVNASGPRPAPEEAATIQQSPLITGAQIDRVTDWAKKLAAELIERWNTSPLSSLSASMVTDP